MDDAAPQRPQAQALAEQVASARLLQPGRRVVVLLSGGPDSTCLLDLAVRISGAAQVTALHVNYGLRDSAEGDERLCRRLASDLGVSLVVHSPPPRAGGNLQAWARHERYAVARELAAEQDADVAAGHTADDQVETLLYRLAASPGRRALLGMRDREGSLVRPLLAISRDRTVAYCRERGLPFATDPSNASDAFARNRIRARLLPAMREIHPAAVENALRTVDVLRDEAEVLDALVAAELERAGTPPATARLAALAPALRRLAVQALADRAAGESAPAIGSRADEILALAAAGGTASLDLPAGLVAEVSYGRLSFRRRRPPASEGPADVRLAVPGRVAFGGGELTSELGAFAVSDGSLDAAALEDELEVRSWRPGDRMRPLGSGGSRTLQDIFTDAKVPRERRGRLPVVVSAGEIAWIPGVATAERFRVPPGAAEHVRLTWAARQYD